MTSGTKVLLALIGLFVGILVLYYGFLMPSTPPGSGGLVRDPVLEKAPPVAPAPAPAEKVTARQVRPFAAAETGTLDRSSSLTPAEGARTAGSSAATVGGALGGATQGSFLDRPPATAAPNALAKSLPAASGSTLGRSAAPDRVTSPGSTTGSAKRTAPARAARSSAPTAAQEYTRYVVKEGDTLTSIAGAWFGDQRKWDLIAKLNSIDPNRLKIGQVLRLPPRAAARPPIRKARGTVHTVRAGDSLSSIAFAYYGDRGQWQKVFSANRDRIGTDPDALEVGMQLRIPQ